MLEIKWIGSPNCYNGRHGYKPVAIVNHIMCGTLSGTDSWFQDKSAQVSAHYGVGKDGSIHQYVRDEDGAWANGVLNHPNWSLLNKYPGVNPNYYTLSIEHEGNSGDCLTEEQYQATLWLHKQLISKFGILVDTDHIIGHNCLDSVNRADCPGDKFPWDRLFKDLGGVGRMLQKGDSGDDVKQLQHDLNQVLGTNIAEDGKFGPATAAAVKSFQQINHLAVDGIAGPDTLEAVKDALKKMPPHYPAVKVQINGKDQLLGIAVNNVTYLNWGALDVFGTPYTNKGNGVFDIGGIEVKWVIQDNNTYLPWASVAPHIKATPIPGGWNFTQDQVDMPPTQQLTGKTELIQQALAKLAEAETILKGVN